MTEVLTLLRTHPEHHRMFQTVFQTNHGDLHQQYLQRPGGTDPQEVLDIQVGKKTITILVLQDLHRR